jgi:hypothetical protein
VLYLEDRGELGAVGGRDVGQDREPGALLDGVESAAAADQRAQLGVRDAQLIPELLDDLIPDENPPERGAETLLFPTETPDLAVAALPPPVPRAMPLTASTRDGTEMVRAAAGLGAEDSTDPAITPSLGSELMLGER